MSLRARLQIALMILAAFGLAAAGATTYRQLRTSLISHIDAQLTAASGSQVLLGALQQSANEGANFTAPIQLPAGTYVELRSPSGSVLARAADIGFGESEPDVHLPTNLPTGTFTIANPHYRVQARHTTNNSAVIIVAIPLKDVDQTLHRLLLIELLVTAAVLVLLGAASWFVIILGLRPLSEMEDTALSIAEGDLSRRIATTNKHTEVGRLGIALNEMLRQIEESFAAQVASESQLRRFVADASHELRTPLTSIRGYAELFRRGAASRPEDSAKAMQRIEESAVRMSVLVEDLLELARLDQGRPLAFAELDLEHLVTVAVDDARVAAPDHPITTSLAPVRITGDADRLAQVVLNLLSNATTHTPPGTAVQVQLTADETGALLVVQDNGPGLPPGVEEKVFERFWRADPSRTRDSGGTGLGLSIVSAIVAAHGGTVRAASAAGAIFTVHLPFIPPDPPAEEPADATDQPGDVTR